MDLADEKNSRRATVALQNNITNRHTIRKVSTHYYSPTNQNKENINIDINTPRFEFQNEDYYNYLLKKISQFTKN